MASESELRARLHGEDDGTPSIDVAAVIRRARARRRPRVLAAGAVLSLAAVGVAVPFGVSALGTGSTERTAAGPVDAVPERDEVESTDGAYGLSADAGDQFDAAAGGIGLAPAEKLHACAGPLAEVAPSRYDLRIAVELPAASAGAPSVTGSATLTNAGESALSGTTSARPAVTVSEADTVRWHTNGPADDRAVAVELAPGESMTYAVELEPVRCGPEDESRSAFRDGLPPLPSGSYDVTAAILFLPADGGAPDLVTGPAAELVLR